MKSRLALVMPSLWFENFPRTLVEAFSCGLPVIASRLGAMAALIRDGETGLLFNPGDASDLAAKLAWAQAHPDAMHGMGEAARKEYESKYTPQRNLEILRAIYREAMTEAAAHEPDNE
jgi:glycosyltransferase involved in cell wall biosynthesis